MSVPGPMADDRDFSAHGSISDATLRSFQTFDGILQALQDGPDRLSLRHQMNDNIDRFRIWAGNIGARHPITDKRSADHKLREARAARTRILELLVEVNESNEELLAILVGDRPDGSEAFADAELDDEDLALLAAGVSVSEAEELCLSTKDSITSLLKVSALLRKVTTRDRYAKAAASTCPSLPSIYDIQHILEKFPKLRKTPWLADRLGQAITQRRQFLRYSRDHYDRISHERKEIPQLAIRHKQTNPALQAPKTLGASEKPTHTATNASTVMEDLLTPEQFAGPELDDEDDAYSHGTSRVSFGQEGSTADRLRVISLQSIAKDAGPFQCPYCYGIVQFKRYKAWE